MLWLLFICELQFSLGEPHISAQRPIQCMAFVSVVWCLLRTLPCMYWNMLVDKDNSIISRKRETWNLFALSIQLNWYICIMVAFVYEFFRMQETLCHLQKSISNISLYICIFCTFASFPKGTWYQKFRGNSKCRYSSLQKMSMTLFAKRFIWYGSTIRFCFVFWLRDYNRIYIF